jgi:hypothetical protein
MIEVRISFKKWYKKLTPLTCVRGNNEGTIPLFPKDLTSYLVQILGSRIKNAIESYRDSLR